ncbi:hypothetical protein CKA81_05735 [Pollutimonas thiosulfatoxidans]|uniref:UspA domain-containing protein n=2 Tax=Pollutimonas thiosulfatoxidans TaxID=2028345 RepID=A0A410GAR3_9BURK|nr:hypothetical protein CKA81_05735 [Pollutimonas thiosulfatoxidans]
MANIQTARPTLALNPSPFLSQENTMLVRIAVHMDSDLRCASRLEIAAQLAAQHKAELVGVYVRYLPFRFYKQTGQSDEIYSPIRTKLSQEEEKARTLFEEAAAANGVLARWKSPQGELGPALALQARYCDLIVMSQFNPNETSAPQYANLAEEVIMGAGRPVLVLPYAGKIATPIGHSVLFCWDLGREAARAFADARPILHEAAELIVLTVDEEAERMRPNDLDPQDISIYSKLRKYPEPRIVSRPSRDIGVGCTILNAATDYGSDLIVMGAYGHSRLREWVLGGASRTLIQTMTVPVLFSH